MSEADAGNNLQVSMPQASVPQVMPQWEYRVIHINVDNSNPPSPPDPKVASERMGGKLSPEFISREFPQQYGPEQQAKAKAGPKHPAEQLQHFLNLLGKEGWEMTTTAQVGQLLMFFFKRPLRPLPKQIAPAQDEAPNAP
ncbi:MAG: hypothetical protein ACO23P_03070 [Vulcanococcus sp.]|jgi:hypothetical protein